MNHYKTLEQTLDRQKAVESLRFLLFDKCATPDIIQTSIKRASDSGFRPGSLLDDAAKTRLSHMHRKKRHNGSYPEVLYNWKGDATEGTPKLLAIARGDVDAEEYGVESYQESMRNSLPSSIPLVRGGGSNSRSLESWSAKVGVARRYGGDSIGFTVVCPGDVFMCSFYGPIIGEQEYTLKNTGSINSYPSNIKSHIEIYQKMQSVLS